MSDEWAKRQGLEKVSMKDFDAYLESYKGSVRGSVCSIGEPTIAYLDREVDSKHKVGSTEHWSDILVAQVNVVWKEYGVNAPEDEWDYYIKKAEVTL